MHNFITSSSKQTNNKMAYRTRPQFPHSHQDPRPVRSHSPVEFKGEIIPSDTPKLIFGHVGGDSPLNSNTRHQMTPQHEENVKFLSDEWQQASRNSIQYIEKKPFDNPNFKPFDLEEYWKERTLNKMFNNDPSP